jgi:hypothetical protein
MEKKHIKESIHLVLPSDKKYGAVYIGNLNAAENP